MRNSLQKLIFSACAVALVSAPGVRATSEGWTTDLAAAKKEASEKKLDIFMNFTGSDW